MLALQGGNYCESALTAASWTPWHHACVHMEHLVNKTSRPSTTKWQHGRFPRYPSHRCCALLHWALTQRTKAHDCSCTMHKRPSGQTQGVHQHVQALGACSMAILPHHVLPLWLSSHIKSPSRPHSAVPTRASISEGSIGTRSDRTLGSAPVTATSSSILTPIPAKRP